MSDLVKSLKKIEPAQRIKELEALVERQQGQIERMRAAKFVLPTAKKSKAAGKAAFTRVFVPDSHGAHIDKEAAAAFLKDLELLRPTEVVMLGDHLDCGALLCEKHSLGVVPETETTYEQDIEAANWFLSEVEKRTPGASKTYIEGNHEARIEREIIKWARGNASKARVLRKAHGPEIVLGLEQRGIRFVKRSEQYDGLTARGTIDLGDCLARHGKRCGKNAAQRTVEQFGCNVAFAHTHRMQLATKMTPRGVAYAWSFGCLAKLAPLYYDTDPTDWVQGYGVQVVKPDEGFLTLQVPIISGKSYLGPLAEQLKL